mmetsp:Transcript_25622/g.64124  ORF Transcript_25622/g.64124 Transcript_25622/m.64124 type:complete len:166 (-) Transcript_25622:138-635(-)
MAANNTANLTAPSFQPPPPPATPGVIFVLEEPVDDTAATIIYFGCGLTFVCILLAIVYRHHVSRKHKQRQMALAYTSPYLPRDGRGSLAQFRGEDEEAYKKPGKLKRMASVAEEKEAEEDHQGALQLVRTDPESKDKEEGAEAGAQDADALRLVSKSSLARTFVD